MVTELIYQNLLDYVSGVERIAGMLTSPALASLLDRVPWITEKMTPLARQQIATNG